MSGPSPASSLWIVELDTPLDAPDALSALGPVPYRWLLDSALRGPRCGRFSFVGADPYLVVRARDCRVELECRRAVRPDLRPGRSLLEHDPLDVVRALLPGPARIRGPAAGAADAMPFLGGAVGWLGYGRAQQARAIVLHGRDGLGLPGLALLFIDSLVAIDHEEQRAFAVGLGFAEAAEQADAAARTASGALARRLAAGAVQRSGGEPPGPTWPRSEAAPGPERAKLLGAPLPAGVSACFDEAGYAKAVSTILDEIEIGNVYQANLTHRLGLACSAEPLALYRALRRLNPAPFAAYLELPEVAVLSSSPERFLRLDREGRVESRPIKGTRPRGISTSRDRALERELAHSPKDRAENLMIVDLVRNDLGRVCEVGSVEVPELMRVERFASVFQMVSTVTGQLRGDRDAFDLIRATFPPGSMTGAPKIAAIRLLDRIEPVRRAVYSGALGYLDLRGGLDFSVVIRTLLLAGGRAHLHVGGGVVADSDPVGEYRESLDKARALLAALAEMS